MWMAAGFSMLEAGLVRSKNTAEILTKNIALFAIACTMYLLVGYYLMYSSSAGGVLPSLGFLLGGENSVDAVLAGGDDAPTTPPAPISSSRSCSWPPPCRSSPARSPSA